MRMLIYYARTLWLSTRRLAQHVNYINDNNFVSRECLCVRVSKCPLAPINQQIVLCQQTSGERKLPINGAGPAALDFIFAQCKQRGWWFTFSVLCGRQCIRAPELANSPGRAQFGRVILRWKMHNSQAVRYKTKRNANAASISDAGRWHRVGSYHGLIQQTNGELLMKIENWRVVKQCYGMLCWCWICKQVHTC